AGGVGGTAISGNGTHHDPWRITLPAGTTITKVDVTDLAGIGGVSPSQSRGFLQLQNVPDTDPGVIYPVFGGDVEVLPTPGSAGRLEEWRLYNSASSGAFTLSYDGRETEALPYNATAGEIQIALAELMANSAN